MKLAYVLRKRMQIIAYQNNNKTVKLFAEFPTTSAEEYEMGLGTNSRSARECRFKSDINMVQQRIMKRLRRQAKGLLETPGDLAWLLKLYAQCASWNSFRALSGRLNLLSGIRFHTINCIFLIEFRLFEISNHEAHYIASAADRC